jgi:hypothetical protein
MDDHHFGYITILGINKERKKERKKQWCAAFQARWVLGSERQSDI